MTYKEFKNRKNTKENDAYTDAPVNAPVNNEEHNDWDNIHPIVSQTKNNDAYDTCMLSARNLTLNEYLELKDLITEYESMLCHYDRHILTGEDLEKFDKNFEQCMDDLLYTDGDFSESYIDHIVEVMNMLNWKWVSRDDNGNIFAKIPTFDDVVEKIEELYHDCVDRGLPEMMISTGGITIRTSLANDHSVSVEFNVADTWVSDYDQD